MENKRFRDQIHTQFLLVSALCRSLWCSCFPTPCWKFFTVTSVALNSVSVAKGRTGGKSQIYHDQYWKVKRGTFNKKAYKWQFSSNPFHISWIFTQNKANILPASRYLERLISSDGTGKGGRLFWCWKVRSGTDSDKLLAIYSPWNITTLISD